MGNCFKSENPEPPTQTYFTVYQRGIKTRVPSLRPAISNPLYKNRLGLSKSMSAIDTSAISNTAVENSTSVHITTQGAKAFTTDDIQNKNSFA